MLTTVVIVAAAIFVFPGQVELKRGAGIVLVTWRPLWQVVFASPVQQAQPVVSERHQDAEDLCTSAAVLSAATSVNNLAHAVNH